MDLPVTYLIEWSCYQRAQCPVLSLKDHQVPWESFLGHPEPHHGPPTESCWGGWAGLPSWICQATEAGPKAREGAGMDAVAGARGAWTVEDGLVGLFSSVSPMNLVMVHDG